MARPATGKTPLRNIRVPDDLWQAAKEEAAAEGRSLTDVILGDLHRYVTRRRRERGVADGPAESPNSGA
jgi:predicted HicB family RNase H-like nuclease